MNWDLNMPWNEDDETRMNCDLNMPWNEDDETLFPTQFSKQPSTCSTISSHTIAAPPQAYLPTSNEPWAVQTPLSTVTNHTPNQAIAEKKSSQSKEGKKILPASASTTPMPQPILSSDINAANVTASMPMPSSTKLTSQATDPVGDKPVMLQFFFQYGHWNYKETTTLLDGIVKLLEEIRDGSLGPTLRSPDERWKFISNYCVQQGVLRSQDQCHRRWDRILATFKKIHNYERHIPSGGESYWTMSSDQRDEMKLPHNFPEDVYKIMLDYIASRRLIHLENIRYHTSKNILGDSFTLLGKTANLNQEETMVEEGSSVKLVPFVAKIKCNLSEVKKRKIGNEKSILKKELESTIEQFLALMEGNKSNKSEQDYETLTQFACSFMYIATRALDDD